MASSPNFLPKEVAKRVDEALISKSNSPDGYDGGFCAKNITYQNIGKLTQKWINELEFEIIGNVYEVEGIKK